MRLQKLDKGDRLLKVVLVPPEADDDSADDDTSNDTDSSDTESSAQDS